MSSSDWDLTSWLSPGIPWRSPDIHLTLTWPTDHHLTFPRPLPNINFSSFQLKRSCPGVNQERTWERTLSLTINVLLSFYWQGLLWFAEEVHFWRLDLKFNSELSFTSVGRLGPGPRPWRCDAHFTIPSSLDLTSPSTLTHWNKVPTLHHIRNDQHWTLASQSEREKLDTLSSPPRCFRQKTSILRAESIVLSYQPDV